MLVQVGGCGCEGVLKGRGLGLGCQGALLGLYQLLHQLLGAAETLQQALQLQSCKHIEIMSGCMDG